MNDAHKDTDWHDPEPDEGMPLNIWLWICVIALAFLASAAIGLTIILQP